MVLQDACMYIQVHLNKLECREKSLQNVVQKVKLSYILDSLHVAKVKHFKSFFVLILMIRAYSS